MQGGLVGANGSVPSSLSSRRRSLSSRRRSLSSRRRSLSSRRRRLRRDGGRFRRDGGRFVAMTVASVATTVAFVATTVAFVATTVAFVATAVAFVATTVAFVAMTVDFRRDDGRFRRDDGRFRRDDGRFRRDDGRFRRDDGRFRRDDSRFRRDDGRFRRDDGRFRRDDGGFVVLFYVHQRTGGRACDSARPTAPRALVRTSLTLGGIADWHDPTVFRPRAAGAKMDFVVEAAAGGMWRSERGRRGVHSRRTRACLRCSSGRRGASSGPCRSAACTGCCWCRRGRSCGPRWHPRGLAPEHQRREVLTDAVVQVDSDAMSLVLPGGERLALQRDAGADLLLELDRSLLRAAHRRREKGAEPGEQEGLWHQVRGEGGRLDRPVIGHRRPDRRRHQPTSLHRIQARGEQGELRAETASPAVGDQSRKTAIGTEPMNGRQLPAADHRGDPHVSVPTRAHRKEPIAATATVAMKTVWALRARVRPRCARVRRPPTCPTANPRLVRTSRRPWPSPHAPASARAPCSRLPPSLAAIQTRLTAMRSAVRDRATLACMMLEMPLRRRRYADRRPVERTSDAWVLEDDKVPESPLHDDVARRLDALLRHWIKGERIDAQVGRNLAIRMDREHPRHGVDPDVYVLVPPMPPDPTETKRGACGYWEPGHVPPRLVVESCPRPTRRKTTRSRRRSTPRAR